MKRMRWITVLVVSIALRLSRAIVMGSTLRVVEAPTFTSQSAKAAPLGKPSFTIASCSSS